MKSSKHKPCPQGSFRAARPCRWLGTAAFLGILLFAAAPASAERLKQLVEVQGARRNPLVGYGLVVGLQGTGDFIASNATQQSLAQLMRHLGVRIPPHDIRARNVAMVVVTAQLPAFARSGALTDVTVSSTGTARSLQGGTLVATPLKGADMLTYALAQGPLSVGGFSFEGFSGSAFSKNHTNVGRIPGGGVVEREAPGKLPDDKLVLILREPDFTTAERIAASIRADLGAESAKARDGGTVDVMVPADWKDKVSALVAQLETLEAVPDAPARVVIDERTGTVVIGANVALGEAAVAHGGLSIRVSESPLVSQPSALGQGQTQVVDSSNVEVDEKAGEVKALPAATTVGDIAAALNALKVTPRELIPILHALKAAGALRAEIRMM